MINEHNDGEVSPAGAYLIQSTVSSAMPFLITIEPFLLRRARVTSREPPPPPSRHQQPAVKKLVSSLDKKPKYNITYYNNESLCCGLNVCCTKRNSILDPYFSIFLNHKCTHAHENCKRISFNRFRGQFLVPSFKDQPHKAAVHILQNLMQHVDVCAAYVYTIL